MFTAFRITIAGCLSLALCCDVLGEPPNSGRDLPWSRLAPEGGKPFVDPFARLSNDQISDLGYVIRVRRLVRDQKLDANGSDAEEAQRVAASLQKQGIDIEWLMIQRERIAQLRAAQVDRVSKAIASDLGGKQVNLSGFVIPTKTEQGRLSEFFLVPTLAACSHEDPPPRLQCVFVSLARAIDLPSRNDPIRLTGRITASPVSKRRVTASGPVTIHSAYTMTLAQIERLSVKGTESP